MLILLARPPSAAGDIEPVTFVVQGADRPRSCDLEHHEARDVAVDP